MRFLAAVLAAVAAWGLFAPTAAHAEPCTVPGQCASGFCVDDVCCDNACDAPCDACSAAKKVSGADGTCGQAKAGEVCDPPHCDGATFSFVDTSTCDAAGACVAPMGVDCLVNDPCKIDLCGEMGCEHVVKNDGTDCGGGQVCTDGVCGAGTASTAAGTGGAGGSGGAAAGGSAPAAGGAAASAASGAAYPPEQDIGGCGCRAAPGAHDGLAAAALLALALVRRRQKRKSAAPRAGLS